MDQVVAGYAETGRSDLFDLIIGIGIKTGCVLAAFAGIAHAAELIHGPGHTFVGFLAEGAVTHGTGTEPFDDIIFRFDFFDGDAATGRIDEVQQIAQPVRRRRIDPFGIFAVEVIIICTAGFLQELDCLGIDDMSLSAFAVLIDISLWQGITARKSSFMTQGVFFGYFFQADAANGAGRIDKILLD